MDLKGKVALVTGGAQGIGKATALRFLLEGAAVMILDSDRQAGQETEAEYGEKGQIAALYADVAAEDDVQRAVAGTVKRFGRLDYLVNNAGIFIEASPPLEALSLADWNRVIGVNLTGAFLCAKYCAPYLRTNRGSIVNIASTRALMSEPGTFPYSASKGGIAALTHSLAVSLGPDITVNCISPGWIETGEWKKEGAKHPPQLSESDHRQHPAGRVGRPDDIASAVLFLVSQENRFITGANLVIDGGMTRKMIYA
jgi:NAD(P)-dependent dehydrogenase (short-subunit alcohol dehydrogenase family)